jgi:hypothetical protein
MFILNKVKANLGQLVSLEVPDSHYRGPSLRNALLDLMEYTQDMFFERTSHIIQKERDNSWLAMGPNWMVFGAELERSWRSICAWEDN